jgi:hypothetical protein
LHRDLFAPCLILFHLLVAEQGLIRHFRPEIESRIAEYKAKKEQKQATA